MISYERRNSHGTLRLRAAGQWALVLAVLLGLAASAFPAVPAGGTRVDVISAGDESVGDFGLALNRRGDGAVAWLAERDVGTRQLRVRSRARDGVFSPPETLSEPSTDVDALAVAVAPSGAEVAAWISRSNAPAPPASVSGRLFAAVRPRGGSFGPPQALSDENAVASDPALGVDRRGTAILAWVQSRGRTTQIEAAVRPPGTEWATPQLVAEGRDASRPQLSFNGAGDATLVWQVPAEVHATPVARTQDTNGELLAAERRAGRRFGRPQLLSDPRFDAEDASIAQNARGDAAVVWVSNVGRHFRVDLALRRRSRAFGRARPVTSLRADATAPAIAIGPDGKMLAVWRVASRPAFNGCNCFRIEIARGLATGHFGPAQAISPDGVDGPTVATSTRGALVLWVTATQRRELVQGRSVSLDGRPGRLVEFSPSPTLNPVRAIVVTSGAGLVGWTRRVHDRDRLEVASIAGLVP